jgi:hypothetical protein
MILPHIAQPRLVGKEVEGITIEKVEKDNHWHQFIDTALGNRPKADANWNYAGPLTEAVLLGSVATRFPKQTLAWDAAELASLCESLHGYSNADLEAMTLLGLEFRQREPALTLVQALQRAKDDFMPPQEGDMIRFMELLAVSETSRRSLLPERFARPSIDEIQHGLRDARVRALGR